MPRTRKESAPLTAGQAQLVEANYGLVFDLTRKYGPALTNKCHIFDLDDINSLGCIGLVDAAGKYNPNLGVPFGAYAAKRILGAMLDGVRKANGNYRKNNSTNITIVNISDDEDGKRDPFKSIKDDSADVQFERVEDRLDNQPRVDRLVATMSRISRRNLEIFKAVAQSESRTERGGAVNDCAQKFGLSKVSIYKINSDVTDYLRREMGSASQE